MSLNKNEQKIYELLKSRELYRNEKGIFTMCPQKLLIRLSGKSERTVRDISKNLEKKGYIHRELLQEENIMLYYFLNEDFSGRAVYDRYENCRPSTVCTEKIAAPPQSVLENCRPSTICTGKIAPPPQSVLENCRPSTICIEKNCRPSTVCTEKIAPPPQSVAKNAPPSTVCTEKMTPPPQSVVKNAPPSTVCTEKMSPPPQSVQKNEPSSTVCTAITQSHKKTAMPHIEMSDVIAERMFYTMPNSSASHLLFDILAAGENIANIPKRKKYVNHGTKYEVKASGNKRQVSMENYQGTAKVTVELADINILNKAGKKLLILSMIKANEQSLHNGELTRDYISFPLQELVDYGLYSRLSGARKGFAVGTDALTSIKIKGTVRKTKKSSATIQALEVPFTGAKIENNQCFIYLNNRIDWKFLAQYFTKIPKYYFKLSNRASDLLYYIFYLARQHTNEIAERGYFTVSFRAIHSLLQLPDPRTARNPQRDIKEAIENAITEIETEHSTTYGNKELSFSLVYSEQSGIAEYLDNGYLKVSLSGTFAEFFIEQNHTRESKIDREEKKQARITEKAKAIYIAKSMENGKPHTQDGNN